MPLLILITQVLIVAIRSQSKFESVQHSSPGKENATIKSSAGEAKKKNFCRMFFEIWHKSKHEFRPVPRAYMRFHCA